MDIERKLYQELLHWKQKTQGKKVLLIEGARRVGKSTIAEKFGREQYRSYLLIDFNKAPKSIKDNFEYLNELDIFFQNLSPEYNVRLWERTCFWSTANNASARKSRWSKRCTRRPCACSGNICL